MDSFDVIIVGAGIIGLATGHELLKINPSLKICILEKEKGPATHQTGNNSGVIHSGVYYKPGSLKAKNCITGKKALLEFCEKHQIATKRLGKVIVATDSSQLQRLTEIEEKGKANGIELQRVCASKIKEIEPNVSAIEGIWIPEVRVVSYKEVAEVLLEEIKKMGGEIYFNHEVVELKNEQEMRVIQTPTKVFFSKSLINCAGLFSDRIALKVFGRKKVPHKIIPFRGEYYQLKEGKQRLINGLIYPVPDPRFPFLGVHLTPRINGEVEAGPNAILALSREGYRKKDVHFRDCLDMISYPGFWKMALQYWKAGVYEAARSFSKKLFLRDLQKLVPAIQSDDLISAGAGIRAQVVSNKGKMIDDFVIAEEKNMVHVLNAPSPAATASFSIGREVAERLIKQFT